MSLPPSLRYPLSVSLSRSLARALSLSRYLRRPTPSRVESFHFICVVDSSTGGPISRKARATPGRADFQTRDCGFANPKPYQISADLQNRTPTGNRRHEDPSFVRL